MVQGGPDAPSFAIINMVQGSGATGTLTYLGNNDPSCSPTFNITKSQKSQIITVPLDCNPLAVIQAEINNNVPCTPYSTNAPPFPLPTFYILGVKTSAGVQSCRVCDNPACPAPWMHYYQLLKLHRKGPLNQYAHCTYMLNLCFLE